MRLIELAVLVVLDQLASGCAPMRVSAASPQEPPSFAPLPVGAVEVDAWSDGRGEIVTFAIAEPFPGEATRKVIEEELGKRGWTPRLTDLAGQVVSKEGQWITVENDISGETYRFLTRYWMGQDASVLEYVFSYRESDERRGRLEVLARHLSGSEALRLQENQREMLEEIERTRMRRRKPS